MVDTCWLCSLLGWVAGDGGDDIVPESETAPTEEPPPPFWEAGIVEEVDPPSLELVPPGAAGEGGESEAEEEDAPLDVV